MLRTLTVYIPPLLFLLATVGIVVYPQPVEYLKGMTDFDGLSGYLVFVSLLVIATVFMPVTVMPLIPVSAAVFGPLPTALLSILGWTLGGLIAFLIARHVGRPVLERFISMEKIDSFSNFIPPRHRFLAIVLLRLTLPVDVVSYALGLTKSVGLLEFTFATLIGVSWFSFAFAYLGQALLEGNIPILIELGALSLLIFGGGWYMLRRTRLKK